MKEALKLALEALQLVSIEFVCNGAHHAKKDRHDWLEPCPIVERYQAAITAIKEALAQPEQEPVAWKNAAIRLGEELSSVGPDGYYDMTAQQWLDWAMEQEPRGKNSLAQPEQEPVFKWCSVFQEMPTKDSHLLFCFGVHVVEGSYTKKGWASLAYGEAQPDFWAYMPPPPHHKRNQELYAMPPKRPWVGLTDAEKAELWGRDAVIPFSYADAIEAKLKEKNT